MENECAEFTIYVVMHPVLYIVMHPVLHFSFALYFEITFFSSIGHLSQIHTLKRKITEVVAF
jgi:hypothetical protein